jgi:pimeloyl-ACP methyl ester carboxylesterase
MRPTVIFSHGYCLAIGSWIHQRRALVEAGYRCVLWDQRGHGRSGRGEDARDEIDQLGRDLERVIAATTPDGPIVLIGHSMGGMTAMALAAQFPDLIAKSVVAVVLVATSAGGAGMVTAGFGTVLGGALSRVGPRMLGSISRRPDLWRRARHVGQDMESLFVERFSFASPVSEETVRYCADMLMGTDLSVVGAFIGTLEKHDKNAALEAFADLPVLVINGEGDVITPPEHSDAIVAALPEAEHLVIADAGHLVMLEHPSLVNMHILALLDRVASAAPHALEPGVSHVVDMRRRGVVPGARLAGQGPRRQVRGGGGERRGIRPDRVARGAGRARLGTSTGEPAARRRPARPHRGSRCGQNHSDTRHWRRIAGPRRGDLTDLRDRPGPPQSWRWSGLGARRRLPARLDSRTR